MIETQTVFDFKTEGMDFSSFKVRDFIISEINYRLCLSFCKQWHYSKTCPAGKIYFGLFAESCLIGVICYGEPAMRNQKQCYDADIELRRLCCIDKTPKNTESYFIGNTLKVLKKMNFKRCISLADPNHGHTGIIYRASNFTYMGLERGGGSRDIFIDGEKMHSRTAFAKYGVSGYAGLSKLFPDKKIEVKDKERKHVYLYSLCGGVLKSNTTH
jgi:hypothetical protein